MFIASSRPRAFLLLQACHLLMAQRAFLFVPSHFRMAVHTHHTYALPVRRPVLAQVLKAGPRPVAVSALPVIRRRGRHNGMMAFLTVLESVLNDVTFVGIDDVAPLGLKPYPDGRRFFFRGISDNADQCEDEDERNGSRLFQFLTHGHPLGKYHTRNTPHPFVS